MRIFGMLGTAELVKALGRFADVASVLAFVPALSHVKFSGVLEAARVRQLQQEEQKQGAAATLGDGAASGKAQEQAPASAPTTELRGVPSATALFLLALAEVFSSWQLFDPADAQVRRAAGEAVRFQQKSGKLAWDQLLGKLEKLLDNDDIYAVLRFLILFAAIVELMIHAAFYMPDTDQGRNPLAMVKRSIVHCMKVLASPGLGMVIVLVVATTMGNYTALSKFLRKKVVTDLLGALPALLRAVAASLTFATRDTSDPMPHLAAFQMLAAAARALRTFKFERIALTTVLALSKGTSAVERVRAALAMEAWLCMMMVPIVLTSYRKAAVLALLLIPLLALAEGGEMTRQLEPLIVPVAKNLATVFAIMALLILVLGGVRGMTIGLVAFQALVRIHGLDHMKF